MIAVFGMRVVFPVAIVAVATKLGFRDVVDQALNDQDAYARNVERAAPIIGSFGGTFLLLVALSFLLDPERETHWLGPVERRLSSAGRVPRLPVAISGLAVIVLSLFVSGSESERDVLLAGLTAIVVFVLVRGVASLVERMQGGEATGAAGLGAFL